MDIEKAKKIEGYDLEGAMKRLDEVVARLSAQSVSIEDSLALYEEGVALVRLCNARLESVERKISLLRTRPDGEIVEEPFGEKGE